MGIDTTATGAQCAQGDALIDLHVLTDVGGLADDDAGAVVDEEVAADLCAGVDVDTGAAVGVLRHHAGDHGDGLKVEKVCHAIGKDGEETGIGEGHFLAVLCGGVAVKDGVNVGKELTLHLGQLLHHAAGDLVGAMGLSTGECEGELLGEIGLNALKEKGGVVLGLQRHQGAVAKIGGEHQLAHLLEKGDDGLTVGQAQAAAVHGERGLGHVLCHGAGSFANMIGVHLFSPPSTNLWTNSVRRRPAGARQWFFRDFRGAVPAYRQREEQHRR